MNTLGHIGYAMLFGGQLLLAYGEVSGWFIRMAGEALWLYIGVKIKMNSIWF